jgi:hypothetical protein
MGTRGDEQTEEQTEALTHYGFGFQLALISFVPFSLDSRPHFARLSPHEMFWHLVINLVKWVLSYKAKETLVSEGRSNLYFFAQFEERHLYAYGKNDYTRLVVELFRSSTFYERRAHI